MRKLTLQMQMTIDGFVAGPDGQLDWMSPETDEKQISFLQQLTDSMDTILLGRKMAVESIPHWENVANTQTDSSESEYARIFVSTPKIIFSKTIMTIKGKNVTIENGDLAEAVMRLKNQKGKDIIVYGGAKFVSALIANDLIDEYNLLINPTAISNGLKIFDIKVKLKLAKSITFENGIVANQYLRT